MPDSSDIEAKVVLNLNALVFRRRKEMVMQYVEEKRPRSGRTAEPPRASPATSSSPGDTLWDIAKKFYTTTDKIRELNELKTETLTPMQQLLVERV